jgi:subtilisin family serine protease
MPKYLIAQRVAGTDLSATRAASPEFRSQVYSFASALPRPPKEPQPEATETVVVDSEPDDLGDKLQDLPANVIVEEEKPRQPAVYFPLANLTQAAQSLPAGLGSSVQLMLASEGRPLDGATVTMAVNSYRGLSTSVTVLSDASGRAVLPYDSRFWVPSSIAVVPRCRAWSIYSGVSGPFMTLSLPALPRSGPLNWWHRALGVNSYSDRLGEGIRVGVIDTGVGPNPNLQHVKSAGAFLNGSHDTSPNASADVAGHGSHVAGIIGARPVDPRDFAGIAPGVELVAARVYPGGGPPGAESGGATNGDIAQAILTLVRDEQCDIINISSGGLLSSDIETDRIAAALDHGTLLVCAAGNTGTYPVLYPAADPATIAVSALGVIGGLPNGVLDSLSTPTQSDRYGFGGFFAPTFNSLGWEIKCAGPGLGIISTVPARLPDEVPYAAMSGTSMACPMVSGALAAILSRDQVYRSLPRNRQRSMRAWTLLAQLLRFLGILPLYEGAGIPTILGQ